MNVRQIKEHYVGIHIVNTETGEIITTIPDTKKKKKVTSFDKYIGIETRLPKDCMTADQLTETLSVMDGYLNDPHRVNDTFLIENALAGLLTLQQQTFLRLVAQRVCGWNYYFGNIKELSTCGVDSKSLSRVLKTLETNLFLKVIRKDSPYKGDITITLNPLLVWKGDNQYREQSKMRWYGVNISNN